jgi:histone deacetylase 1/2
MGQCHREICDKEGHYAKDCWSRYEEADGYGEKEINAAYGVDNNWYQDSGATHHITGELNNLSMRYTYKGHDKVNTANGQGMRISNIDQSIVHNHGRNFHLRNVLYVPNASKNLLSVHRFTYDNRVFIEFHPFFLLIKDQVTKKIIHRGRCVGGLYPLISSLESSSSQKHAFVATTPSQSRWHNHLGHPSFAIVRNIVNKNKLPCVKDSSHELVCDPCQQAKSHQLPYPIPTSVSTIPLQLVFSDV